MNKDCRADKDNWNWNSNPAIWPYQEVCVLYQGGFELVLGNILKFLSYCDIKLMFKSEIYFMISPNGIIYFENTSGCFVIHILLE